MATDDARAFWVSEPGRGEIRVEALPEPGPGECVVRTLFTGVSLGTESLVFLGRVPVSEHERMRAPHQQGEFPGPVKYGYSSVGRVEHGPRALLGRTVFCLYPHQTRYIVPAAELHTVPEGVPPGRAVLAANLTTALNALWDAAPPLGARVRVVGAGAVGCLAAWCAAGIRGADVELVDIDPGKRDVAAALGVRFAAPDDASGEADVVIHASGAGEGLVTALALAGFEATVIELSWYGDARVSLPLGEAFHSRRLTIRSSQVASITAPVRARFTVERRLELAFELLADPALDALLSGETAFEDLPAELARLARAPAGTLCRRIVYA